MKKTPSTRQLSIQNFFKEANKEEENKDFIPIDVSRSPKTISKKPRGRLRKYAIPSPTSNIVIEAQGYRGCTEIPV